MERFRTRRGRGFTLVEMLVVVTIIGILAAILIPTVATVQRRTKNTVMTVEMEQLGQALEAYKLDHKDYPPDFTSVVAVDNHVRLGYPRNNFRVAAWLKQAPQSPPEPQDPTRLDPAEALVFWLSLLKKNARNPFTGSGEFQVYYEFKAEQLTDVDGDGWPEYASKHAQGAPYVYFDGRVQNSRSGGASVCSYAWAVYPCAWSPPYPTPNTASLRPDYVGRDLSKYQIPIAAAGFDFGIARPYRSNELVVNAFTFPEDSKSSNPLNNTEWVEPRKFQILCAGLDGVYGTDHLMGAALVWKQFPVPNYYNTGSSGDLAEDYDNLGNFGDGTVGDSIP